MMSLQRDQYGRCIFHTYLPSIFLRHILLHDVTVAVTAPVTLLHHYIITHTGSNTHVGWPEWTSRAKQERISIISYKQSGGLAWRTNQSVRASSLLSLPSGRFLPTGGEDKCHHTPVILYLAQPFLGFIEKACFDT